jgi:hypothetical protein
MPRERFPSDDKRLKQRPHVKVHLSWPTHPRYAHVYADRNLRAVVLGVWVVAARAHVSATNDEVTMLMSQVMELTACNHPPAALQLLRRTCAAMGWTMRQESGCGGVVVVVGVRNFARKQGFRSANGVDGPRSTHASEEPKNQGTEEPKSRRRKRTTASTSLAPSELSQAGNEHVRAWVSDVMPAELEHVESLIEESLDYLRRKGEESADWGTSVVNNIRNRFNSQRQREGLPKLMSRADAKRVRAEIEAAKREQPPLELNS